MPQIDKNSTSGKSYKREVAVACLVVWGMTSIKLFGFTDPAMAQALATPYSAMTYAVYGFGAAAYGMEWMRKQSPWSESQQQSDQAVNPSNDGIE